MDISGVTALVTGAGSGLGAATAKALAKGGANVAVLDLNADNAKAVAQAIGGLACVADVADEAGVNQALDAIAAKWSAPRIVVSCAGIGPAGRVVGRDGPHSLAVFEKTLRVNLVGTFNVMRLAAARMTKLDPLKDDERGVIVNTASVAAFEGQMGQCAYAASKGGVHALSLPAARELARFGIRVAAIAPGVIRTPLLDTLPTEVADRIEALAIFPHRFGHAEEYASLVLAIVGNPLINGTTIRLDGAVRLPPQ
jgi:NAD(P)-dependent dehydrogenase (short-subunit alcohol dehydrogenase family)